MEEHFITNPDMAFIFSSEDDKTKAQYTLGAALAGTFPSYFKDKPKPVKEGSREVLPDMPGEPKEGRLVVIGDSEFPSTLVQYTNSTQNLEFLVQAADWLGNDSDILSIRTRLPATGRLNKITDPAERAQAAIMAQIINVLLIPLAIIGYGVYRYVRRKSKLQSREARHAVSA